MTVVSAARPDPTPPFLILAGHPIRWRLLVELARSDLHVGEMTRLVDQPQGLVSYHLGQLRARGLVSSRRSSRDGRAIYYRTELERCGESLAATAAALHPGLGLSPTPVPPRTRRQQRTRVRVLFVCTGNSARSQIAEALLQQAAGDRVAVASAGSAPKAVHPDAVNVLAAAGIDISSWHSKPLTRFTGQRFDYVVTLCDRVRERCPEFPGDGERIHWSIEDPTVTSECSSYQRFQHLSTELATRIHFLVSVIDTSHASRRTRHDS